MESEVWDTLVSGDPAGDLRSGSLLCIMSHGAVMMAGANGSAPLRGLSLRPRAAGPRRDGPPGICFQGERAARNCLHTATSRTIQLSTW